MSCKLNVGLYCVMYIMYIEYCILYFVYCVLYIFIVYFEMHIFFHCIIITMDRELSATFPFFFFSCRLNHLPQHLWQSPANCLSAFMSQLLHPRPFPSIYRTTCVCNNYRAGLPVERLGFKSLPGQKFVSTSPVGLP